MDEPKPNDSACIIPEGPGESEEWETIAKDPQAQRTPTPASAPDEYTSNPLVGLGLVQLVIEVSILQ